MTIKELSHENETLKTLLKVYEDSPFESSYMACLTTIENFNRQLTSESINIMDIEDKPKFEMAHKYLTELDGYLSTLDKIRGKMNPDIAKNLDAKAKQSKIDQKDKSLAL
jgi:hypothetical protein